MTVTADVVVLGAGVTGCSIAYRLARAGQDVVVVERGHLSSGSSGACDGYIAHQTKRPGVHLDLALSSVKMVAELSEELGYDVQYNRCGSLIIIRGAEQWAVMEKHSGEQRAGGLDVQMLDRKAVQEAEPFLSGDFDGATYCALDGRADPLSIAHGFHKAAVQHGARFMFYSEATSVEVKGNRVVGVKTAQGRIACDTLIVACGVWTPEILRPLGIDVPIKPRRGFVMVTEQVPHTLNNLILDARYIAIKMGVSVGAEDDPVNRYGIGLSLEQTHSGNILIGNTRQFVGFDTRISPEILEAMRLYTLSVAPKLAGFSIIRTFAGLRPYTPDGLPLLGPVDGFEGLVLAAGHEGDGIALSPITGRLISDYLHSGRIPADMQPCLPQRFVRRTMG
ncbi:MAG: NAD(P)/FAD-dependent oxidoreductase [Bacillota bacterium]